ncbi:MAG: universal stress protein [Synechococcaceae cyanobacterium RL_1_2]|nr:universal stress protein [Synechococcaceae cyanobacterium RL_1_2]
MFKRSLICTNLNDGLTRFTDYVPQLAASGLEQIVFVHNVPLWQEGSIPHVDQEKVTAATAKLAKALIKVPTGVEVKVEVPSGRVLENICELITKYQSDVIFVSNSAKGNIQKTLFGSNLAGLTEKTSVPLFVLRPQLISTYREDELALRSQNLWRYLLVPYNGGEASNYLIEQLRDCLTKYGKGTTEKLCSVRWWRIAVNGRN